MDNIKRYIIGAVQNDTDVNRPFFNTIKSFCNRKNAELILMPTKYMGHIETPTWDEEFDPYLLTYERNIGNNIKLLGDLYLLSSIENPIIGFDVVSKGKTVILGHPQYQMKALPRASGNAPIMLTSTGAVTEPNVNSNTKTGKKAIFNHSYSVLYLSVMNEGTESEEFHIRTLNWDGYGFYDIDGYYSGKTKTKSAKIQAIVTGDEHIIEVDPGVAESTYGKGGIVETLKPDVILRGDVLDCISISHHNKAKVLKQNLMESYGKNDLEKELNDTCEFILNTTPKGARTWLVASNHNDHLDRWLEDPDSNLDKKNAKLYHWFMSQKLDEKNKGLFALEIYMKNKYPNYAEKVRFLDRDTPEYISDIEVQHHGDLGFNGSRANIKMFSRHTSKTIIGHSHSPGVDKGCYQVGTSSKLKLEYTHGLSSWMHTHCLVYENGKRQLINIINGRWFI